MPSHFAAVSPSPRRFAASPPRRIAGAPQVIAGALQRIAGAPGSRLSIARRAIAFAAIVVGCNSEGGGVGTGSGADARRPGGSSPGTTGATAPLSAGSGAASARPSASPASPATPLAGQWRGTFEASKAPVSLDPGVGEPAWKLDDGSKASGKGSIEVAVAADGTVSGRLDGALGQATISGSAEGEKLFATFNGGPDAPEPVMAGTFTLTKQGAGLSGSLRASSGDAKLVRMATLELTAGK